MADLSQYLMSNEAMDADPDMVKQMFALSKMMPKQKQEKKEKPPTYKDKITIEIDPSNPGGLMGALGARPELAEEEAVPQLDPSIALQPPAPEPEHAPVPEPAPQEEMSESERLMQSLFAGPTDEEKAAKQQAMDMYNQSLAEQKEGLKESQKLLDAYKSAGTSAGKDYTPLLALVDSMTGSNFLKSYKPQPGETAEKKQYKIAQLSDMLAKRKGDITKQQADILKQFSGGAGSDPIRNLMRAQAMEKTQGRFEEKAVERATDKVSGDADKINKSMIDIDASLATADQALASGRIDMLTPVLAVLAREISGEKGVLTDRDVNRTVLSTLNMDMAKLNHYLGITDPADYDPRVVQGMQQLIKIAKANRLGVFKKVIDKKEAVWKARETKGYKTIMKPGGSGDIAIKGLRDTYKSLSTPTQAAQAPMAAPAQAQMQAPAGGGGGPAVGTIEDGHRFKGGNPADPNSWEPM